METLEKQDPVLARFMSPFNHPKPLAQAIRQVLGLSRLPVLPKVKQ